MSDHSAIEWTDATWNPTTGCTKISPGCAHCYIERTAAFRIAGRKFKRGRIPMQLHDDRLEHPLHWRKPRLVFVNSLSDLFHDDVPFEFVDRVLTTILRTPQHIYQLLTKRPVRMQRYMRSRLEMLTLARGPIRAFDRTDVFNWPPSNLWLGVSAENKATFRERVPLLLQVPAAVRWISCEPLLEDIVDELFTISLVSGFTEPPHDDKIDWVVIGGESGPGARRCDLAWLQRIVEACRQYHTPVFVKQLGERVTGFEGDWRGTVRRLHSKGGDMGEWPIDLRVREYPEARR